MDHLEIKNHDDVIVIRFTRPEIRNPLSLKTLTCLHDVIASLAGGAAIRALIFTGSENVFASGADLREISALSLETAPAFAARGQSLMKKIDELPIMTVAAINGFCFGGALDLALSCRKRIAAREARFAHPGTGLGIITGWGGTQRLPRLVGQTNGLEMFFTAESIDAERALAIALIDEIAADPLERALAFVEAG